MVRSKKFSRFHELAPEGRKLGIIVHGLKACDSTRAALKALAGRGARLHDLREAPVGEAVLRDWLARLGPGLLNRASATWRGLPEAERLDEPVALMLRYPALIKRPVIAAGERLTLGWTAPVRALWSGA
jgi:arsenate reductase-like glutaredoxin family protein